MKAIWSSAHGGGGRGKFTSAGKPSADEKDLNTLVASTVAKAIELKNKAKAKAKDDSDLYAGLEYFNFEKPEISAESNSEREHGHEKQLNTAKLCAEGTLYQKIFLFFK